MAGRSKRTRFGAERPDVRLRRRRGVVLAAVAAGLGGLMLLDRAGLLLAARDGAGPDGAQATIVAIEGPGQLRLESTDDAGAATRLTVRLLGVGPYADEAERARWEPEATAALRELAAAGVEVRTARGERRARWRAPGVRLLTPGGEDVAAALVRRGLVRADPGAARDGRRVLEKADLAARRSRAGLWSGSEG